MAVRKIRILIVDDHPMVREGLEAMLMSEDGFEVVALAANGQEAVRLYYEHHPEVVLSDIRMPVMDGFALLDEMMRRDPAPKVLLLAGMPLKEEERRAREHGAKGYLPKDVDLDRLSQVIRDIAAGGDTFACAEFQSAPSPLTAREMDVLRLAAQGMQRDKIAATLGIGPESVKTHMKGVLVKLDCPNSAAAVGRAYELGILRA